MENPKTSVSVIDAFTQAVEITKQVLFRPFDIGRWFIIGFAAWISRLGGGDGIYFNNGKWPPNLIQNLSLPSVHWNPLWLPLILAGGVVVLVIVIAVAWVTSRGKFVFLDCVVRNRAAIAVPWKEFRHEGNDLFLFKVVAGCAALVSYLFVAALAVVLLGSDFGGWSADALGQMVVAHGMLVGGLAVLFCTVAFVWLAVFLMIPDFIVPIMYRTKCSTVHAFGLLLPLLGRNLLPFFLFGLFELALAIGAGMIAVMVTCMTCCIAAVPYIGTVILLPISVVFRGYSICFLRQFGSEFDVFATIAPPPPPLEPPAPEPAPPQPPPPGP